MEELNRKEYSLKDLYQKLKDGTAYFLKTNLFIPTKSRYEKVNNCLFTLPEDIPVALGDGCLGAIAGAATNGGEGAVVGLMAGLLYGFISTQVSSAICLYQGNRKRKKLEQVL